MSDDKIHIFKPKTDVPVANLALLGLSNAELMTEIERRGVDLPAAVFKLLAFTCASRSARWAGNGPNFPIFERAAEMMGEAGEAGNVAKKLRRLELGLVGNKPGQRTREELLILLENEIGDTIITAINLANDAGADVWAGLARAFNTKSEELGFPERL